MKIKKNDKVIVIKGKDRNKTGLVLKSLPKLNMIIISGVNKIKKAVKPSKKNPTGGFLEYENPVKSENVMIICPHCGKATRVEYRINKAIKERICKKCNQNLG